jgi:hypothetical protein
VNCAKRGEQLFGAGFVQLPFVKRKAAHALWTFTTQKKTSLLMIVCCVKFSQANAMLKREFVFVLQFYDT